MCNYLTIDFSLSPNFPCFFLIESDPTFFKRHIVRENCSILRVRNESKTQFFYASLLVYTDDNQHFLELRMILLHLKDLRKYLHMYLLMPVILSILKSSMLMFYWFCHEFEIIFKYLKLAFMASFFFFHVCT